MPGGVAAHFTGGSGSVRFARALLFGSFAALAGTSLYFLVLKLTGYEVGLIAILVGYMVGAAVRRGTRHRGGLVYQLLAVFLTYTAIVASYIPMIFAELVNQNKAQPAAGAAADPAGPVQEKDKDKDKEKDQDKESPPAVEKADAPPPAPAQKPAPKISVLRLILGLVLLLMLAYAAPFLAGVQNLLGLAIIFFGLMQAWQLNRKIKLVINGPFQVTGGSPPLQELPADA